jgi:hypothetical protein
MTAVHEVGGRCAAALLRGCRSVWLPLAGVLVGRKKMGNGTAGAASLCAPGCFLAHSPLPPRVGPDSCGSCEECQPRSCGGQARTARALGAGEGRLGGCCSTVRPSHPPPRRFLPVCTVVLAPPHESCVWPECGLRCKLAARSTTLLWRFPAVAPRFCARRDPGVAYRSGGSSGRVRTVTLLALTCGGWDGWSLM